MPTDARARLLATAEEMFYAEGVRAVGVDALLARSGVGRASFYRHFPSKDDLVTATIKATGAAFRAWLADEVAARGGHPLAVFDALDDRFASPGFRGCAAINAMVEAAEPTSSAHLAAADHKRSVTDYLDGLLSAAGYAGHARLADQLMLLVDGAMVTALRRPGAAGDARRIAEALLDPEERR
ncbi:TetR/AcrR family transcriptional regulator [Pseudonocardia endophytica]|uniref:TetR family transcriptional regulator n=1 Tax=Pseudonocardia endophytica TaxID=401976 RepID=A0A4R1HJL7_PSEEN|nr:TetR/AcrR family transcriptional regulator [Pseudonocardia endophytica]TCK21181.1 TetR family transcriptional regulator [Pseudonocardia endophytica]